MTVRRASKFTAFINHAISYRGDDCLLWPFYKNQGYGRTWRGYVHVLVCEAVHGPRPPGHTAAHKCGVHACITPAHLRWHTPLIAGRAAGVSLHLATSLVCAAISDPGDGARPDAPVGAITPAATAAGVATANAEVP